MALICTFARGNITHGHPREVLAPPDGAFNQSFELGQRKIQRVADQYIIRDNKTSPRLDRLEWHFYLGI